MQKVIELIFQPLISFTICFCFYQLTSCEKHKNEINAVERGIIQNKIEEIKQLKNKIEE